MRFFGTEISFKNLLISSICFFSAYSSFPQQHNSNSSVLSQTERSSYKTQKITYHLINTSDYRYGYDIFIDKALFIHQPVIPCVAGNKGFKSKTDAEKVAILVIGKIRKGLIPPTVTISEMQKLGIDLR